MTHGILSDTSYLNSKAIFRINSALGPDGWDAQREDHQQGWNTCESSPANTAPMVLKQWAVSLLLNSCRHTAEPLSA